ncbi:MAG: hypothetical protein HFK10_06090 [Clostridia bacterium]|jgi:triacylglycerol lipase|nr:hypothetical protein [Clostridia bacterium]
MTEECLTSRYPIILVHGVLLKDFKFFKAFGRIEKILKNAGFKVYTAKTDGFGTVETNAGQLRAFVNDIRQREGAEKVNLIAHSKGGLDARYMIEHLDMADAVASLTTLCTPHRGSPIASFILRYPSWILQCIAFWINLWYRIFGDRYPNAISVCHQLQLHPQATPDTLPQVYCQSFSTTLQKSKDDFVMGIPLLFSHHLERDASDGLVSRQSTKFGEYRGDCVDDSVSHSEIVDFMAKRKKKERIYGFYLQLCRELAEKGL